jgi:hypothetical protein
MLLEPIIESDSAAGCRFDEMDSAARGFRFKAGYAVSGALIQTQAAVHTLMQFGEVQGRQLGMGRVIRFVLWQFQCRPIVQRPEFSVQRAIRFRD